MSMVIVITKLSHVTENKQEKRPQTRLWPLGRFLGTLNQRTPAVFELCVEVVNTNPNISSRR